MYELTLTSLWSVAKYEFSLLTISSTIYLRLNSCSEISGGAGGRLGGISRLEKQSSST